jgi:hypothetical protein
MSLMSYKSYISPVDAVFTYAVDKKCLNAPRFSEVFMNV